jgi:hypothetical protein
MLYPNPPRAIGLLGNRTAEIKKLRDAVNSDPNSSLAEEVYRLQAQHYL